MLLACIALENYIHDFIMLFSGFIMKGVYQCDLYHVKCHVYPVDADQIIKCFL